MDECVTHSCYLHNLSIFPFANITAGDFHLLESISALMQLSSTIFIEHVDVFRLVFYVFVFFVYLHKKMFCILQAAFDIISLMLLISIFSRFLLEYCVLQQLDLKFKLEIIILSCNLSFFLFSNITAGDFHLLEFIFAFKLVLAVVKDRSGL